MWWPKQKQKCCKLLVLFVHVKQLFMTVEHKFPLPGHTFLPCDRDFGVIEKKKRKTVAVYNPEGWFTLVEKARVKKSIQSCAHDTKR